MQAETETVSGQQTPPPCPAWCADVGDAVSVAHRHRSAPLASAAYIVIAQWPEPGEKPEIRLSSWDPDTPVLAINAAQARMLADLMTGPVATALRAAADMLDEITSGSAS